MSTPNPICPILEGFTMGETISSHNGVVCYPAMRDNTDEKYILKVISLPASSVQLAALVLSGAYASKADALQYYAQLGQEILAEVRTISELSRMDGFLPFLDAHMAEKSDGSGYQVFLMHTYQQSLAQIFSEQVLTHKAIFDLTMDLCSALSACRSAGYLYVDLKPENIFVTVEGSYRIGDLGLLPMSSLKYASLPEKYHSCYTAPEIQDAGSEVNTTLDVYAVGCILYQAYNGGTLPQAPLADEAPLYADYEMAEIIQTACNPDPQLRWQTPAELGQALVQYMQRNSIDDSSIIPAPVTTPELDVGEEFLPEEETDAEQWEDIPELKFLQDLTIADGTAFPEETPDLTDPVMEAEISQMLAQADDLIEHPLPDPVVAPEPIEVPMPEPIVLTPEVPADEVSEEQVAQAVEAAQEIPPEDTEVSPAPVAEVPEKPVKPGRSVKVWLIPLIIVVLLAAMAFGARYYYQNIYLQNIDQLTISGTVDSITVQIQTEAEEALLRITCSDTYGNLFTSQVSNGTAVFQNLTPGTRYTIRVMMDGNHKLTGTITDSFTTENQTVIENFTAVLGPEDGSVYLSFLVSGQSCDQWQVSYEAPGIPSQSLTFTGHSTTISGLEAGAAYTFTLSAQTDTHLIGQTQVQFTARNILRAENAVITACGGGKLTVQWQCPAGQQVQQWTVRCFDGSGYDETITVTECSATFEGLTHETACTVEIVADGMPQGVSVSIGADPLNILQFIASVVDGQLILSWEYAGNAPQGGWIVTWSRDGGEEQLVETLEDQIQIIYVPGSEYAISLATADGSVIFGQSGSVTAPAAEPFAGFGLTQEQLQFMLCRTPGTPGWTCDQIEASAYKTEFTAGETAGFVIWCDGVITPSEESLQVMMLLQDSEGNIIAISQQSFVWNTMWFDQFATMDLPALPDAPGSYRISVYWNGMLAAQQDLTVN